MGISAPFLQLVVVVLGPAPSSSPPLWTRVHPHRTRELLAQAFPDDHQKDHRENRQDEAGDADADSR